MVPGALLMRVYANLKHAQYKLKSRRYQRGIQMATRGQLNKNKSITNWPGFAPQWQELRQTRSATLKNRRDNMVLTNSIFVTRDRFDDVEPDTQ